MRPSMIIYSIALARKICWRDRAKKKLGQLTSFVVVYHLMKLVPRRADLV